MLETKSMWLLQESDWLIITPRNIYVDTDLFNTSTIKLHIEGGQWPSLVGRNQYLVLRAFGSRPMEPFVCTAQVQMWLCWKCHQWKRFSLWNRWEPAYLFWTLYNRCDHPQVTGLRPITLSLASSSWWWTMWKVFEVLRKMSSITRPWSRAVSKCLVTCNKAVVMW